MKNRKKERTACASKENAASRTAVPSAEMKRGDSSGDGSGAAGERSYFEVARAVGGGGEQDDALVLTESQRRLLDVQGRSIDLLLKAYNSMIELAAVRLECKLSNTRVSGVARELRELIKVMSVYDC